MARPQENISLMLLTPRDILSMNTDTFYELVLEASPEELLKLQTLLRFAFAEVKKAKG